MECYKNAILAFVSNETFHWSAVEWKNVQNKLRQWQNHRDKHYVFDYFNDHKNRLCYANRLYGCRVDCFLEILRKTYSIEKIRKTMSSKPSIVSFGCGPGPEIAAYVSYVRNDLNLKNLKLNIVGVDILAEWKPFIDAVSELDRRALVTFKVGKLNKRYLRKMPHCDVCIMSYPHAMNFEDIWDDLKKKFTIIIFIDQPKPTLLRKAKLNGFKSVRFKFSGDKTFFYYIDKSTYKRRSRYLHRMDLRVDRYQMLVNVPLNVGHKREIYCYESDTNINDIGMCHDSVSGSPVELEDWSMTSLCYQNEYRMKRSISCKEMVKECKINDSFDICGSKKIFKVTLKCGHTRDIICGDESQISDACLEEVMKICSRGLHRHMLPCYSTIRCDDNIIYKLVCGHEHVMKCYEDIPLLVNTSEYCNVKNDGHMAEIEFDILRKRGSNDDDKESLYLGSFDNKDNSKKCKELGDKVLNCGHRCLSSCNACLNGRLRRRYLEYCPRVLKCGHRCTEKCH